MVQNEVPMVKPEIRAIHAAALLREEAGAR